VEAYLSELAALKDQEAKRKAERGGSPKGLRKKAKPLLGKDPW